jgi:hypothetical protein
MSLELERRAFELFAEALALAEEEREAFLRSSAADSPALTELLLRMLREQAPSARLEQLSRQAPLVDALRLEGRRLGDFQLLREIGGGAVGRVFEAEQVSLQRRVAVKVLRLEHVTNEEMVQRFRGEPAHAGQLRHPNIVQVLSTGSDGPWLFFAMDYIEGATLARLIEDRNEGHASSTAIPAFDLDSARDCAALVETIARALHFAHERGIVHRDVKPHNVLIDRAGVPYLSDFGLARALDKDALTASLADGLRGTLSYMSPEQAIEFHSADARADVYSLGAVLYQMLTRCLPFEADTGVLLLTKILSPHSHVRPPHHFLPGFDAGLSGICTTALEKQRELRFESALEMAECLRAFREGRPVDSRPVARFRQIGERRLGRRALVQGAGAAAVLLAGGVFASRRAAHARAAPSLRLELDARAVPAEVSLVRVRAPEGTLDAPRALGRFTSGEPIRGIEPGSYRVVVRDAQGAFAELQRTFGAEGLVVARPTLTRPEDASAGMVRVAGGRTRAELPASGAVELDCAPFWIDRSPVTNGEFAAFLRATEQWPSPDWSPSWAALWSDAGPVRRPANWDELPVVRVSWARAREYAEWRGKRLPTFGEWLLALGIDDTARLGSGFWRELAPRFEFAQPAQASIGGEPPTTLGAYLAHTRPARLGEEDAYGPHKLWHPFGNVGHRLESGAFQRGDAGIWTATGERYEALGAWHFTPWGERAEGLIGKRAEADASGDLGFRCAKSAKA